MSTVLGKPRRDSREKVDELRTNLGLFSFRRDQGSVLTDREASRSNPLAVRRGGIVEWLVAREGAGGVSLALKVMSRSATGRGVLAVVDPARECYVPALSGWGIEAEDLLVLRPATLQETCWAIEQCLRCPGVSATWAWVDRADSRAGSSSLADGGGSGRRRGLVLSAGVGPTRARMGRLTIAGHAAGWRAG